MAKLTTKREAEFRKAKRDFQEVLDQLLEEEWQRLSSAGMVGDWSEEEERKMLADIRARRRPLSDRRGAILDVTGTVDDDQDRRS
jgi:hypothetical protein